MKFLITILLVTVIQFSFSQKSKKDLYIVFEKTINSSEELTSEMDKLNIKRRTLKKYNTTIYYSGLKFKHQDYQNLIIKGEKGYEYCEFRSFINTLDLDKEYSFCISNESIPDLFRLTKKEINKVLKKAKKKNKNRGILLFDAKEKPRVEFIDVPDELNSSNICKFAIKSNSNNLLNVKIWSEQKDKFGDWEQFPKQTLDLKEINNQQEVAFYADGKLHLEYQIDKKSYCTETIESKTIKFNYKSIVKPIELIHEGNNTDGSIPISTYIIDQRSSDKAKCGAQFEILPEVGDKYFFYTKKQIGIESITMEMKDLCSDGNIYQCKTNTDPIYLTLEKDLTYESENFDKYIILTNKFDDGERFSCLDFLNYTKKSSTPVREWEITLIPNLNSYSELESIQYRTYRVRFNYCNGKY